MWVRCEECGCWSSADEVPETCPDCGEADSFHSPENNPYQPDLVYPPPHKPRAPKAAKKAKGGK